MSKIIKILQSTILLTTLFFISIAIAQEAIYSQNQETSVVENNPIRTVENDNCQGSTEVVYHSQKLTSPDGNSSVYFDAILRRIGQRGDEWDNGYCYPTRNRQTPFRKLVIESSAQTKSITFKPANGWDTVMNPISFSG